MTRRDCTFQKRKADEASWALQTVEKLQNKIFLYIYISGWKDYSDFLRVRRFCHNTKDLYLQLRIRKRKKDKPWKEKQLHGKSKRETEEVLSAETWGWIRKGYLEKETEGLIFAAQEQTLGTNWIKKHWWPRGITKMQNVMGKRWVNHSLNCRM